MSAAHSLDNPIWEALRSTHAPWAVGNDLAKRYPKDISPLCGMRDQSAESYAAMGKILAPDEYAALFLTEPAKPPKGWTVVREFAMDQMICDAPPALPKNDSPVEVLGPESVNEMKALAELTKPGPFDVRTVEFGGFLGVRDHGKLVAMAGQRTRPRGFTEVSAVCTHPDARGRGLAELLVAHVTRGVFERGEIPFLELKTGNAAARRVYEKLGYRFRRNLLFAAVRPD